NFRRYDLSDYVASLLNEYRIPASSLTIELTESTATTLTPDMHDVVRRLRQMDVGLSIDDFGTGFSNLSSLVNLPVTEVKLDRMFIEKALEDTRLRALVSGVVAMGSSLGLTVVAEGVETRRQYDLLKDLRCDVVQGYLFSRAIPPESISGWIAARYGDARLLGK
ncbi:MAG: EAL domain-containing protein, partial [Janthinobacterium lividum]